MAESLAGTVALVTGASSGIGEATALSLAAAGADVAVVARRKDKLDALAEQLRSSGVRALAVEADVTDEAAACDAVEQTVRELGRLDTVVNNAGVMLLGPIVGADTEHWRRMINLNVLGLMYVTAAALPHLLEATEQGPRNVADLITISSVAGRVARSGSGVYNASKWAVNAFSESLRQEVTERHLRVGVIEPGAVATELVSHNSEEIQAGMNARFKDWDVLQAEDIADAITYTVTRPVRVAVNEMLIRPTDQQN